MDSDAEVGQNNSLSARSVNRYIRLNELLPDLLEMVDNSVQRIKPAIAVRVGVDLSYLPEAEQQMVLDVLSTTNHGVDAKKSEKLREYSKAHRLNEDTALLILSGAVFDKPAKPLRAVKLPMKKLKSYLPAALEASQYESYILEALAYYREHDGHGEPDEN